MAPGGSAPLPGFTRDPYDSSYEGPTLHTLSDDERLDELVPQHALSKVRRWLAQIEQTMAVTPDLHDDVIAPQGSDTASEGKHRMPSLALGVLCVQTGRPDLAERYIAEDIPLRDGEPDLASPRLGDNLILLGVTREMLGRPADAVWAHEWAVRATRATI